MPAIDFFFMALGIGIFLCLITARHLRERAEADRPKSAHPAEVWASAWDGTR